MTSNMTRLSDYIACPDCDYLLEEIDLSEGKIARCPRCGSVLHKSVRNSLQKAVALSSVGLIFFGPAVTLPIMTFTVAGLKGSGNVLEAMLSLCEKGFYFVGFMVLLVSVLFPLLKLSLLFIVSIAILSRHVSGSVKYLFRLYQHLSEWGMVEVYMLGILVAIIKMYSMASINYNTGFFCFTALVVLTVWSSEVIDEHLFWDLIEKREKNHEAEEPVDAKLLARSETAMDASLIRCHDCGKLSLDLFVGEDEIQRCPRCRAALHRRKPGSLNRTWALVLAAGIFYLPANILPMMRVNFMISPRWECRIDRPSSESSRQILVNGPWPGKKYPAIAIRLTLRSRSLRMKEIEQDGMVDVATNFACDPCAGDASGDRWGLLELGGRSICRFCVGARGHHRSRQGQHRPAAGSRLHT